MEWESTLLSFLLGALSGRCRLARLLVSVVRRLALKRGAHIELAVEAGLVPLPHPLKRRRLGLLNELVTVLVLAARASFWLMMVSNATGVQRPRRSCQRRRW